MQITDSEAVGKGHRVDEFGTSATRKKVTWFQVPCASAFCYFVTLHSMTLEVIKEGRRVYYYGVCAILLEAGVPEGVGYYYLQALGRPGRGR